MKSLLRVALLLLVVCVPAQGQSLKDRLKAKVKDRADENVEQAADKGLDKLENTVKCATGDSDCIKDAKENGQKVVLTDDDGKPLPANKQTAKTAAATPAASARPGEGAWANYDFVPGEKILFADDFSADRVGNFPRRLQLDRGNMELIDKAGKRWLRISDADAVFIVTLPEPLGRRFTMEYDVTLPANWCSAVYFSEAAGKSANAGASCSGPEGEGYIGLEPEQIGFMSGDDHWVAKRGFADLVKDNGEGIIGMPIHVRMQADGEYAKLYVGETRVANVPSIKIPRGKRIFFAFQGGDEEHPILFANLSVNNGGSSFYDALMADGHVATQGIFFDVGSDRIRPESTPTLKQIGDMLKEHADLKLEIQGHTDNTVSAASNLTLSEKRAAAVKAYLISNFGVDAARLQSKGYGDTKPAAPNTTPEGKQQNRRVELVKL